MEDLGGILTLSVLQAKLHRDTEAIGEMDPFVQINYLGTIYRTKSQKEGGKNPSWNESFDLQIQSMGDEVEISIFDEDILTNDLVASSIFQLATLCKNQGISLWIPLNFEGKKAADL